MKRAIIIIVTSFIIAGLIMYFGDLPGKVFHSAPPPHIPKPAMSLPAPSTTTPNTSRTTLGSMPAAVKTTMITENFTTTVINNYTTTTTSPPQTTPKPTPPPPPPPPPRTLPPPPPTIPIPPVTIPPLPNLNICQVLITSGVPTNVQINCKIP